MKFKVLNIEWEYNGFFNFRKLKVEYDKFNGAKGIKNVEVFDRGDSAAILLYEQDTKSIILTNQFRYPTTKHSSGWLNELVAGKIENSETGQQSIKREIQEEIGYEVKNVELIGDYYLSPGGTTEKIYIYFSEVRSTQKTLEGGGKLEESEDIETVKIPLAEIANLLITNRIRDAKTAIALQWFLLNKVKNGV